MDAIVLARGLADAMLYHQPLLAEIERSCALALGRKPRWLKGLAKAMVTRYGARWTPLVRDAMVQSIIEQGALLRALRRGDALTIRRYFVLPATMAPQPLGFGPCTVPALAASGDVARWLDLSSDELDWYARERPAVHSEHYVYRWLSKRSGGQRLIEMPKARLRQIQRKLLHGLLDYVPTHEAVHGFRTRHSIVTNAQMHVGQRVVLRLDLQDFFLTLHGARVTGLFRLLGYSDSVARTLMRLCTNRVPPTALGGLISTTQAEVLAGHDWHTTRHYRSAHLPQGAPTSPALANLCAFNLDVRLQAAADQFEANYTRYADDLSFSGGPDLLRRIERFIALVGAIALEEGLRVNFRKTRVMTSAQRQLVTGVVVNHHANLPRGEHDVLKAILHNCVAHGPRSQNRAGLIDFRAHLTGRVAHASMINAGRAAKLRELLRQIDWSR